MKTLILFLVLSAQTVYGQKFKEWFRQKKTQRQYLIQQIAQLKIYLELTEKGYEIAKEGLTLISDIKDGEFTLHKSYFGSLKTVNPKIASYPVLKQLTDWHDEINVICKSLARDLTASREFTDSEIKYVQTVLKDLYDQSSIITGNMLTIVRDGQVTMSDDERIARLDQYYQQMQSNYQFAQSFQKDAKLMAIRRKNNQNEINTVRALHGLN